MSSVPIDQDGRVGEPDLVSTLASRVRAIEDFVQTTTDVVDEKALKELRRTIEANSKRDPKFEERLTNKVDVLADRIETVAKTVSTASASVAAKEGEIVQLRRELEAVLSRVNSAILEAGRGTDPAELADMRRALDEVSKLAKQRMPRGLEGRVDELAAKFALVAQRVDSVSETVSTTAAGLAGRDGDVNALRRAFEADSDRLTAELAEVRRGFDPAAMADLRQAVKEVADEATRQQHWNRDLVGQAGAKADALAGKLDSLVASFESTASRVSATEEGLSAFRAYFEDAGGRLSTLLGEHNQSLAALSTRANTLEQADAEAARALEERSHEVRHKLDQLVGRLESSERASGETARLVDERISDANDRIEDFVGRLEPLSAAVTSATERLEDRDDALQSMEQRFREATTRVDGLVVELSQALAELPDPGSIERALATRIDEVDGRTASLADHVTRIETSVTEQLQASTSSADVERLHEELVTVRGQVDEADERMATLVARQRHLLDELGARTAALEQTEGKTAHELDERVADVSSKLDELGRRLEESAATVTSTAARVSGSEDDVSALREYVEKAGSRLSSLVAEHKQALAALDVRAASLEQADGDAMRVLGERMSATSSRIDEVSSRLEPLVARASDDLAERIEALDAKLGAAAEDRAEAAGEIARVAAILEVDRASLRAKFDTVAVALEKAADAPDTAELERRVADLTARVQASAGERASFQAQFEAIANALASIPQQSSFEQRLDELDRRLDEVEQRGAAVASKVSHASALLPTALRSLEARLDEVSPGARKPAQELVEPVVSAVHDDESEAADSGEIVDRAHATVVPIRATEP